MGNDKEMKVGEILWRDLTVENAEEVRDFYQKVVGWKATPEDMEGYFDFHMSTSSGKRIAGICHARGMNKDIPPQWLIYIIVQDLDKCVSRCEELGGKVIAGPKDIGKSCYCIIQDPAGAVAALWKPG